MKTNEYISSLKKIVPPKVTKEFDKIVGRYEVRVKEIVHQLDLKTSEAKQRGKKQIELFSQEMKKTKLNLEKSLTHLLNKETEKINEKLENLVVYLKKLSLEKETKGNSKETTPKLMSALQEKKKKVAKRPTRKVNKVSSKRPSLSN